ncbi:hypothetical protein [Enterovibrio paralichthyis]|uniref:hypothetical protein n=1 Tax=Enterovibrio paralichthyis TaxID=2853805 RepID=UPI0006CFA58E|nr:hypothetical protein [Enterovibrio paralichthyis]MBV7298393.1 hypothetical protein [Enterovibrio paralichthyis]
MADRENKLFCDECGEITPHTLIELKPQQAAVDATLFQRATIVLSNSLDMMLGSSYQQCCRCGATFGHSDISCTF